MYTGFAIDLYDSSGTKTGAGPLRTATRWRSVARLNRAGTVAVTLPASDPLAGSMAYGTVMECYAVIDGARTLVSAGIVQRKTTTATAGRPTMVTVTGADILGELRQRTVGGLVIDDGSGGATNTAPTLIMAYAPSGWSLDTTTGYSTTAQTVLHTYSGESVLEAFVRLSEMTGENFRTGSGRSVVWLQNDTPSSGVRLINHRPGGESQSNVGYITSLNSTHDSAGVISRIYPHGADTGAGRVTLATATWTPPAGYVIDTANNYLERTDAVTSYGQVDAWRVYNDITDADTLAKAAYGELLRAGTLLQSYTITVTGLEQIVRPGETVRVLYREYRNGVATVDVDDAAQPGQGLEMVVMEAETSITASGIRTTRLRCANVVRWNESDQEIITNLLRQYRPR